MLVKKQILFPKHLLLNLKKSIQNIIVFWIYSPFGVIKKVLADLFFFKKGYYLTLFFFLKNNRRGKDSALTQTTLLSNAFVGLSRKYRIDIWIKGVGFKFKVASESLAFEKKKTILKLSLGYSHLLKFTLPKGCTVAIVGKKKLFFNGICFQELTQLVSYIQKFKLPDPYKVKGLNYKYKVKVIKPGKTK
jgi:ribosomal protein L6P/L9E